MATRNPNFFTHHEVMPEMGHQKATLDDLVKYQKLYPHQRFELVNGQIIAGAGMSLPRCEISTNIAFNVRLHLLNHQAKCRIYRDVWVKTDVNYRLPDFVVSGNGVPVVATEKNIFLENPVVIGEILSAENDATEKLAEYQKIVSIQNIVFVSQNEKCVTVYHRANWVSCDWHSKTYTEQCVCIESINCTLSIGKIYENLVFD